MAGKQGASDGPLEIMARAGCLVTLRACMSKSRNLELAIFPFRTQIPWHPNIDVVLLTKVDAAPCGDLRYIDPFLAEDQDICTPPAIDPPRLFRSKSPVPNRCDDLP